MTCATAGPESDGAIRLKEVVATLARYFPPQLAENWDSVGLVTGDLDAAITKVMFAVDPVASVVAEALEWGADLLVTHHPLLLRPVHSVATSHYKGALVHRLIRGECALLCAHTNADSANPGVADALAELFGLRQVRPLVEVAAQVLDRHVVYVPTADAERVIAAMANAGAGALGNYRDCTWRTEGLGSYTPGPGSNPTIGIVGEPTTVAETRIDMVAPRSQRRAVVSALRTAHPYEEVAHDVIELAPAPSRSGIGRLGQLPQPVTLAEFAHSVHAALPHTHHGVRIAGDLDALVSSVAVLGGAGDSLFAEVAASGVDVYVTADLRHHPASEAREQAELGNGRPYLVDVSHWASEWPWLARAAQTLTDDLAAAGHRIQTRVSQLVTDPWTARL